MSTEAAGVVGASQSESTAIVYHEDMDKHFCLWDENYPECPKRFTEVLKRCAALNLLDRCKRIPARSAEIDEIQWKHSRELIDLLECSQSKNEEELEELSSRYDAVYICHDTYRLASLAVGCSLNLVQAVCTNVVKNGMAIIRPPGHHAMKSTYCGYCFFNNVALSAEYALKKFNLKRILIVDWDVHHGQATQQMFYDDPRVLYFSIHRFEHGTFWPNLRESNSDYIGEGAGCGFNFNIPLNKTGLGNADYLTIFHQVLLPIALEYQPELILVSAGYDAAVGCPEFVPELILVSCGFDAAVGDEKGKMEVTPACYAHLINSLSHLAEGKIAVFLEGGYFLKSLAEGAALTLRSLLGDACPDIGPIGRIDESLRETILNVIYSHRHHWQCFKMLDGVGVTQTDIPVVLYSPFIQFNYVEEIIETFPTRDCYTKHSDDAISYFNTRVDELIRSTPLRCTNVRCISYSSPRSVYCRCIETTAGKQFLEDVNQDQGIGSALPSVVDKITNVSNSVIMDEAAYTNKEGLVTKSIVHFLTENEHFNRVMLVTNKALGIECHDGRVLEFNIGYDEDCNSTNNTDFYIKYPFSIPTNDGEFFTFLLKVLLPVAYQYNPEIVVVSLSFNRGTDLSTESYSCLVHWLTSLANGRLILVVNYGFASEREKISFLHCLQVLLGHRVPTLTNKFSRVICTESVNSLRTLIEHLKHKWANLDFIVKFVNADDNRMNSESRTVKSTGIVYHEDMVDHFCLWDPKYTECPERFAVIMKRCETLGLLDRCIRIPSRLAETEEICDIHSPELLNLLKKCESKTTEELEEISSQYDFIYLCKTTYRLALLAAGSTINLVQAVCNDEVKNGMAVVRPPGHHAMKSVFCGYCYFNNVALAANYALKNLNLSRILIVDWDVHHGQATQQMFYSDPRVLYFSIHRFEDGKHWPNLKESNADYIGEGEGKGFNINVPLNRVGLGNSDYLTIFHQILLPVAVEYQPELIIVSAGYDAALGCPEGEMEITPACYAHFVHSLSELANGKLAVVLEGGYCLKSLAEGAALTVRALLGDPCPIIQPISKVDERTRETILNVIYAHKRYWKCFQIYGSYDDTKDCDSIEFFYPNLKYEHEEVKVDRYDTRDTCPANDENKISYYDSLLNRLIQDTELYIPKFECLAFCSSSSKTFLQIQRYFCDKNCIQNVDVFSSLDQMICTILEKFHSKEMKSVIIDENSILQSYGESTNFLFQSLVGKFKNKKIMLINFGFNLVKNSLTKLRPDGNVLAFLFNQRTSPPTKEENNFIINFDWDLNLVNNGHYLAAWFKILFPIAYQFSSELTIIYLNFSDTLGNNASVELFPHFLHWIAALSNGRILFVTKYNWESEKEVQSFALCCSALARTNLPSIPKNTVNVPQFVIDDLENTCRRLQGGWANLDYFVKYPRNET